MHGQNLGLALQEEEAEARLLLMGMAAAEGGGEERFRPQGSVGDPVEAEAEVLEAHCQRRGPAGGRAEAEADEQRWAWEEAVEEEEEQHFQRLVRETAVAAAPKEER